MSLSLFPVRKVFGKPGTALLSLLFLSVAAFGQTPSCTANSNAALIHQDGLAERVGDIVLTCTGGTAGSSVSATLFIALNTNITNRVDANGPPQGIAVTANTGTAAATGSAPTFTSASTLSVSQVNYTVPAGAIPATITITGIRAAVASLSNGSAPSVVSATVQGVGVRLLTTTPVVVAISAPGLLQSSLNNGVPCNGSPLPATLDFSGFAATSISSAVRVTEASATAFSLKKAGDDSGARLLISVTGYGSGARAFVPDAIVGNSGTTPTSAGAFGVGAAAGTYTPGTGQMLLIRVNGADANGAGGTLAFGRPALTTTFAQVSELSLSGGSGVAVYEVVDSNPESLDSAQVPVFASVSQTNCPSTLTPAIIATLAPVSGVSIATSADPIPRFVRTPPVSDCKQLNDCGASYLPALTVDTTPIILTGSAAGNKQSAFFRVGNTGAGMLNFSSVVTFQSGSGWLTVSPAAGVNNTSVQVIADPLNLSPGTYKASVTVNAGNYGTAVVPVTFTVGAQGVTISNIGNAASFRYGTVVPGSYAVLYGANLLGRNVSVTFNGLPATVIYDSAGQINLIVPAALGGQLGAAVVATVDGVPGNTFKVNLAANAPGIFNPGIINVKDGTINSSDHPAARGDYISVYLTGLTAPVAGAITVNIGSQTGVIPSFAGVHPVFPALDQVNILVPASLPLTPNPVQLQVCAPGVDGQPSCSNAVNLYIR